MMYCKNCGASLLECQGKCGNCNVKTGTGKEYCDNCGSKIDNLSNFCPYCGNQLKLTEPVFDGTAESAQADNMSHQAFNNQQNKHGYYGNNQQAYQNQILTQKSKFVAALLAFFVGCFGVHNFYLGYTGKAIAQLVMTVLVVTMPISAIWAFVEFILILVDNIDKDVNGIPLNKEF